MPLLLRRLGFCCVLFLTWSAGVYAQTSLNLSTDLVRLGIAASNLTPGQSTVDSGPLVEAGIKYAASHQIPTVTVTAGAYYFLCGSASNSATHVLINGITTAMTIDFGGSDLYFGHPEKFGFFLTNLTNVSLTLCLFPRRALGRPGVVFLPRHEPQ